MWPDAKANPIGTCVQNLRPPTAEAGPPARIRLAFPSFPQQVVFPNIPAATLRMCKLCAPNALYELLLISCCVCRCSYQQRSNARSK
jgi:hypothetical protein